MDDYRKGMIEYTGRFLRESGFSLSACDLDGLSSFDLIARRENESYVIKVLYNVDPFRIENAIEISRIGKMLGSAVLLIGERAGNGFLEDGIVYFRHSIPIMSTETFHNYVNGEKPLVYAGPGGYYVSLDGKKMQEARSRSRLSIGNVSMSIGTSRRSISLYESGNSATLEVFQKLTRILKEDISRRIDISEYTNTKEDEPEKPEDEFLFDIYTNMIKIGLDMNLIRKAPFNALARDNIQESLFLMGLFEDLAMNRERILAIKNISDLMEKFPLLVSRQDTTKETVGGCSVITAKKLSEISDHDEFLRVVSRTRIHS
ncbi:MAG: transcriptional regulator [Candidatus Thermoplasmatota archaeon]|jgi:putative transcriptional regulator|nr:transcriptional regulator [Candidatus Thermoplasmatota archaeon]